MKKFKTIFAALTAIMVLFSMTSVVTSADETDEPTHTAYITIKGDGKYKGYNLLHATNTADTTPLYAYTLNDKYTSILQTATGEDSGADIVSYIDALDDAGIREFADGVYHAIMSADPEIEADTVFTGNTKTEVRQGYWLVVDVTNFNDDDTNKVYSLVMLDTTKADSEIKINVKRKLPTVEKEVEEINDSTNTDASWGKTADYDIGDEINFKLTGTVAENIGSYTSYYYEFHDTMENMTYVADSAKVTVVNGATETVVTDKFTSIWDEAAKKLNVSTKDLLSMEDAEGNVITVNKDTEIVVTYSATLDTNAIVGGTGNPNTVFLEYSDNPYYEGDGDPKPDDTGKTPEKKVTVFTYKLVVDKVDGEGHALAGAGFTLMKWNSESNSYQNVGSEIKDVTTFTFNGIDAGQYKLEETTVPEGYNKADDVEFVVVATLTSDNPASIEALVVNDKNGNSITATEENREAEFTVTANAGELKTAVINNTGSELPSTGGAGTVVIYVVGGVIFVGALVLLVAKLRMKSQSEN